MEFLASVFWLVFWVALIVGVIALFGYNKLRRQAEYVKESWSNIGVVAKKQVSLTNQLIEVVKGYADSEKLVMLKVSEDNSLSSVQGMVQQSGMVLSTVAGMVDRFPELKANQHYGQLMDSIQQIENQLQQYREAYNAQAREYNVLRTSIPHVFYSAALGFSKAPYLEFNDTGETQDMGVLKTISSDDGEHLQRLLGQAGGKALALGRTAVSSGKQLVDKGSSKVRELTTVSYFYLDAEQQAQGPIEWQQLLDLRTSAAINGATLVCTKNDSEWKTLDSLIQQEKIKALPPLPPVVATTASADAAAAVTQPEQQS
ncbi:LemA family protein [Chitinibacteraceae bacterium HSL-7]